MVVRCVLVVVALAAAACFDAEAVRCADGRICPVGSTCDEVNHVCIPPGCGDGEVRGVEQCDGEVPRGMDCTQFGHYEPAGLSCNTLCELDASSCSGGRCGDQSINGVEICDGVPPASQTCLDYGFDIGRLECPGCVPEFGSCSAIGWRKMPGGSAAELRGIWGAGSGELFAVGLAGTILQQRNGTWSATSSGTTAHLYGVWGSGPSDVYAVGDKIILHYDGTAWTSVEVPETLRGVWGSDASNVFVVGLGGTIRRLDGGAWTKVTAPTSEHLHAIWGRSATEIYAVGTRATILRWNGSAWSTMAAPSIPSPVRDFHGVWGTADRVFAVGGATTGAGITGDGVIIQLAGAAWSLFALPSPAQYSAWGSSSTDVFFGGFGGSLLRYDGDNVLPQDSGQLRSLHALWGSGATRVLGVTTAGAILEYRGIGFFIEQLPATALVSIRELDDGEVAAVGYVRDANNRNQGRLYRFVDGDWNTGAATGTEGDLWAVWGTTSSELFVASEYASIASAQPGFVRVTGTTNDLLASGNYRGVWGSSRTDVWCVGVRSARCHYDGNSTTLTAPCTSCPDLDGVWGTSASDVYAVGHRTMNGVATGVVEHFDGNAWTSVAIPAVPRLNGVWGTGPANIVVVGNSGTILHYDGAAWRLQNSGTGENLLAIHGTGPTDLFATGTGGTVLHYDGVTWKRLQFPTIDIIYGVWVERGRIWAATQAGNVLRIDRANATSEQRCADTWDDDGDGLVDCLDSDCATETVCARGGTCQRIADVACGQQLEGSTFTGIARIDDLECLASPHLGPEASYRFVAATSGTVTASLVASGASLEVAVLGAAGDACDPTSCRGASTGAAATFEAVAGESYYIVVDGPRDTADRFTLAIECP